MNNHVDKETGFPVFVKTLVLSITVYTNVRINL